MGQVIQFPKRLPEPKEEQIEEKVPWQSYCDPISVAFFVLALTIVAFSFMVRAHAATGMVTANVVQSVSVANEPGSGLIVISGEPNRVIYFEVGEDKRTESLDKDGNLFIGGTPSLMIVY